ncbi:centrosomal protein of 89 kDa-like [Dendronephthya gigantea]|uniref:centrosomal protein of 89 kDa-like n=1 Tax=Dendronephthya gigantea TaxID=151771 RepID=UPI00106BB669|nr:centrosomal protein of 89 kDa-like [Dendronephthya gigantea]
MYSGVEMRQKKKQETCKDEPDSFRDKRRLLSYWKSLDSSTCPVNNETRNGVNDELLVELRKCLSELDDLDSVSSKVEQDESSLQKEQLSLLQQLGEYSVYFSNRTHESPGSSDNLKNSKSDSEVLDALKAERKLLLEENEVLVKQMELQKKEYKSSSGEQQRDIEKLTREVQNFNISRKKLERELFQITKQRNEKEVTINSLRQDLKKMKDTYEIEIQKLRNRNDQVSQENSQLVEKGKEAMENLKIALQQLTEEKKAFQGQKKSSSGKDIREIEASLERVKKEREAFRQRCEKSEILLRNLQEENSSLKIELQQKEKEPLTRSYSGIQDGGDESSEHRGLERAYSRISQLKTSVHNLEDRIKEKNNTILSLRKENARANDIAMEKALEISRTKRILERKIEKLTKENSELKSKFLIPSSHSRRNQENESKQDDQNQLLRQPERSLRRRSNPECLPIETSVKHLNNNEKQPSETISKTIVNPDEQDPRSSILHIPLDVTPKRRIGGKFIRASSKRHSADLGKLMSRHEPVINKKSESEMLLEDEPATIFINKYHKKSEEEHWV